MQSNFVKCKHIGVKSLNELRKRFTSGQFERTDTLSVFIGGEKDKNKKNFHITLIAVEIQDIICIENEIKTNDIDDNNAENNAFYDCFSFDFSANDADVWRVINFLITKVQNTRKTNGDVRNIVFV